ncbi:MAG TPA: hypothetical protein VFA18_00930, partial [Gemmataceae bacterium]|nr:hypothetical protein [Gemmataceae bacterium]
MIGQERSTTSKVPKSARNQYVLAAQIAGHVFRRVMTVTALAPYTFRVLEIDVVAMTAPRFLAHCRTLDSKAHLA